MKYKAGLGAGAPPQHAPRLATPRLMLSSVTVSSPGWAMIGLSDCTISTTPPFAGGWGPLNVPVAGSIVGSAVLVRGVPPRSRVAVWVVTLVCTLVAVAVGVAGLVFLGDSKLLGPDWNELTSNAVTE